MPGQVFFTMFLILFLPQCKGTQYFYSIEEGKSTSCSCSEMTFTNDVKFQLLQNTVYIEISSCNITLLCEDLMPQFYKTNIMFDATQYHATLTVKNIRRQPGIITYRCGFDIESSFDETTCSVNVYVKPEKPYCDPPYLDQSNQHIVAKCTTDRVYPEAQCLLQAVPEGDTSNDTLPKKLQERIYGNQTPLVISYSNNKSPLNPEDYQTECTFRIDIDLWAPGEYDYIVTMYPFAASAASVSLMLESNNSYPTQMPEMNTTNVPFQSTSVQPKTSTTYSPESNTKDQPDSSTKDLPDSITTDKPKDNDDNILILAIGAGSAGIAVSILILAVVLLVSFLRRRNHNQKNPEDNSPSQADPDYLTILPGSHTVSTFESGFECGTCNPYETISSDAVTFDRCKTTNKQSHTQSD